MPNYYSPGVYIEEVNTGPRPIEAVATAVAAFVGFAPYSNHDDANQPVLITSWAQYVEKFGLRKDDGRKEPFAKDAYMPHAVYGYFLNGGTRCYVVRVVSPAWQKALKDKQLTAEPQQVLTRQARAARRPGEEIKPEDVVLTITPKAASLRDIEVSIDRAAGSQPADCAIAVRVKMGDTVEEYKRIQLEQKTPEKKADDGSSGDTTTTGATASNAKKEKGAAAQASASANGAGKDTLAFLNADSKLVEIKQENRPAEADLAFGVYYLSVPQPGANAKQLAGAGQNGLASLAQIQQRDIVGDATERTGVFGLEIAPDVTMVCCPDLFSPQAYPDGKVDIAQVKTVQTAMINHCELAADRVAILDAPDDFNPQKIASWRINSDGSGAGYDSMFAALYYPWITVANPLAGDAGEPKQINIPPCGHIAGIYARNDSERGVHKAPANEIVRGALSVTREITRGEQDGLNPNGINCIRTFPGRGIRVWGARTLTSDPLWRYVSVRRLFNMVEKSIERDTQWVVFEPNTPDLWSRVRRDVNAFLMTLWRDGMLFGTTPDQAFYVKCDAELNPPESRDLGRLIIEVGLAPVKPAEFVIFRFSQFTAEAS